MWHRQSVGADTEAMQKAVEFYCFYVKTLGVFLFKIKTSRFFFPALPRSELSPCRVLSLCDDFPYVPFLSVLLTHPFLLPDNNARINRCSRHRTWGTCRRTDRPTNEKRPSSGSPCTCWRRGPATSTPYSWTRRRRPKSEYETDKQRHTHTESVCVIEGERGGGREREDSPREGG